MTAVFYLRLCTQEQPISSIAMGTLITPGRAAIGLVLRSGGLVTG